MVDVYVRYSNFNVNLDRLATLSIEGPLVYNDDGGDLKAHLKTSLKFALLTAASPLISLARLVRSAVFAFSGRSDLAAREFVGALAQPILALGCLAGSLVSAFVFVISSGNTSFYVSLRRTYAFFEAWIGCINLSNPTSYSQRVSNPMDCFKNRIWTTAPCMQPLLEKGFSDRGGLLDPERVQKMFPFIKVLDVKQEEGRIVVQSQYENESVAYSACDGACEHRKVSTNFCCCWRIESVYDRILCCEIGQGTCTSIANSGDSCGIVSCSACGIGACCCYEKTGGSVTALNTGCFDPLGPSCMAGVFSQRTSI